MKFPAIARSSFDRLRACPERDLGTNGRGELALTMALVIAVPLYGKHWARFWAIRWISQFPASVRSSFDRLRTNGRGVPSLSLSLALALALVYFILACFGLFWFGLMLPCCDGPLIWPIC